MVSMTMAIMVINLDRDHHRWANNVQPSILPEFGQLERVVAVDGALLTWPTVVELTTLKTQQRIRDITQHNNHRSRVVDNWMLDSVEAIGCTLSHMKCWEQLVRSGGQYAIILEDDATLAPGCEGRVAPWVQTLAQQGLFGADVVLLGHNVIPPYCRGKLVRGSSSGGNALTTPYVCDFIGSHAYCLSNTAAQTLLQHALPMEQHVDFFLAGMAQMQQITMTRTHEPWFTVPLRERSVMGRSYIPRQITSFRIAAELAYHPYKTMIYLTLLHICALYVVMRCIRR